jgi:uncharacterized protein involved in copper resistance
VDDPARRVGSGPSDIDAAVRLRYEITRKFAPYVGVTYDGKFGSTARRSTKCGSPSAPGPGSSEHAERRIEALTVARTGVRDGDLSTSSQDLTSCPSGP